MFHGTPCLSLACGNTEVRAPDFSSLAEGPYCHSFLRRLGQLVSVADGLTTVMVLEGKLRKVSLQN